MVYITTMYFAKWYPRITQVYDNKYILVQPLFYLLKQEGLTTGLEWPGQKYSYYKTMY